MTNALVHTDEEAGTGVSEDTIQSFYTAAMAMGTTGSPELDTLLTKGLYGKRTPSELRSKRAAEAFQTAFDLIGGVPRLALWADKNPTAFFALYSKLIPSSVKTDITARITIDAPWMNPNRLSYRDNPPAQDIESIPSLPQLPRNTP